MAGRRDGKKMMKRLTERDEYGNADIIALRDMMLELYAELSFSESNALTDVFNRLAAYEDTGLLPEEIKSLQAEWAVNLIALENYRELTQADKPDWISVKDRTPKSGTVLATDGKIVITAPASSVTADGEAITHWMPLPGLPR